MCRNIVALEICGYITTNKLEEKIHFHANEYLAISRKLGDSIETYTLHPHPDSVRCIASGFLLKYPGVALNEVDEQDSMVVKITLEIYLSLWIF